MANPENLTACGLTVGSDALYITMGTRYVYKMPVMQILLDN